MLVLTRKANQQIQIGNNIVITILQVKGQQVRVGIEAPRDLRVMRAELGELPGLEEKSIVPASPGLPAVGREPEATRANGLPGSKPGGKRGTGSQATGHVNRISSLESSPGSASGRARTMGDHVSRLMRRRTPDAVNSNMI